MIKVFISYAREDIKFAQEQFNFLRDNGYEPWMDKRNILPGMKWEDEIESAVEQSDLQLFLLSNRSVGKRGVFQKEIRYALNKAEQLLDSDISIIPLRLDDCEVPKPLKRYQWLDYHEDDRNSKLIDTLFHACEQRGLISESLANNPVVSQIRELEELSEDGRVLTVYSVPQITIPSDQNLGEMISAIILGQASDAILSFHQDIDPNHWSEHRTHPNELQFNTEIRFLNSSILSATNTIYQDTGGAHGYGYTTSTNILINEKRKFSALEIIKDTSFLINEILNEANQSGEEPLAPTEELPEIIGRALNSNSIVSDRGLEIRFNQYEVFCYAHGPFNLKVSWDSDYLAAGNLTELGSLVRIAVT